MEFINSIIGVPLGWVMWALYQLVNNYGIALFLFTVFSRILQIPTTVKQQKSTAKMAMFQPQIAEIQKKYANNKEKINQETMALYQKEGFNPMSGCLPMLIQLPILFGLIDVIYKPLTHIVRLNADVLTKAQEIATGLGLIAERAIAPQLSIIRGVVENPAGFAELGTDVITQITEFAPKLNFLGIDLMTNPSTDMFATIFSDFNPVLLIPILSGVTSLAMSLITIVQQKRNMPGQAGANSMTGMMLVMPIFSTTFTFSVAAGVGLYWIYSNIVGIVSMMIMNKIYNPKEMAEKARVEYEERKERERLERVEAKKLAKAGQLEDDEKALSQKEINRRRLAEARRRDAEKYGEDYEDDE